MTVDGLTDCPDDEVLHGLMAGTLPASDEAALTGHLGQCPACQQRFDRMTGPDGFVDQVARAVSERCDATVLDQALEDLAGHADATILNRPLTSVSDTQHSIPEQGISELSPYGDVEKWFEQTETSGPLPCLHGYEILHFIGRGGMGVVFCARDPTLDRIVALKVLSPSRAIDHLARERFLREARSAASINHECVATVHAVVDQTDLPCLVMEYIEGESLRQRLDRTPVLNLREVLTIGSQVASGIAAAHARGIVHRDLKPANILLATGEPTRVRLTDFGLARVVEDESLTQSGMLAGTPGYIAPEVAQGHRADYRSDLFSFGCLLYVMSTGQPPFPANSTIDFLQRVIQHEPVPVHQLNARVPDWLNDLIARLLQKNPQDRPQTAAEVKGILQAYRRLRDPSTNRPRREPSLSARGASTSPASLSTSRWPLSSTAGRWIAVSGAALAVVCTALAMRPDQTPAEQNPPPVTSTSPVARPVDREPDDSRQTTPSAALPGITSVNPSEPAFLVTVNEKQKRLGTLKRAVEKADDGSTIVIASVEPITTAGIASFQDKLTITAAAGYVPVLRLVPDGDDDAPDLFAVDTQLTLRGLELHVAEQDVAPDALQNLAIIRIDKGEFHAEDCRFVVPTAGQCIVAAEPTEVRFDRCAVHVPHGAVINWEAGVKDQLNIHGCVITAGTLARIHGTPDPDISIAIEQSTVLCGTGLTLELEPVPRSTRSQIHAKVEDCVIDCHPLCHLNTGTTATFKRRVVWNGRRNLYATPFVAFHSNTEPADSPDSFSAWTALGNVTDQQSRTSPVEFRVSRDNLQRYAPAPKAHSYRDFTFSAHHTSPSDGAPGADVGNVGPGQIPVSQTGTRD